MRESLNHCKSWRLRYAIGGRLRNYKPPKSPHVSRLDQIRQALVRGELALNGFNRWRVYPNYLSRTGWTFTSSENINAIAEVEISLAKRETVSLPFISTDEQTVQQTLAKIESRIERNGVLIAKRNWEKTPNTNSEFNQLLKKARQHGWVVHIIAAMGSSKQSDDLLLHEAKKRYFMANNPSLRLQPLRSELENSFEKVLVEAGLNPIPQQPVANYFLDFGIVKNQKDSLPIRLDIEIDGRIWHEELPRQLRQHDIRRNEIVQRFGWRPVRFWDDEIKNDTKGCIERIEHELQSDSPLNDNHYG